LDVVMTPEAIIGLSLSAPVAIGSGIALVVWRKQFAAWYARIFSTMLGKLGEPFERASTPGRVVMVGCFAIAIGTYNAVRLILGLVT
jgi:hypothetical protein